MTAFIFHNAQHGHSVLTNDVWPLLKSHLMAGRKMVIEIRDFEESMTEKQRSYYHKCVLREIADQATPNGQLFPMEVWKEHYRLKFLGSKRKKHIDPLTGKKHWRSQRVSTEDLGVKGYSYLIEKVSADAAADHGVVFSSTFDRWIDQENQT